MNRILLKVYFLFVAMAFVVMTSCRDKDDPAPVNNELEGHWNWKKSCGGFTGACSYADATHARTITLEKGLFNGNISGYTYKDVSFAVADSTASSGGILYTVKLGNGDSYFFQVNDSELTVSLGEFWETYERLKL